MEILNGSSKETVIKWISKKEVTESQLRKLQEEGKITGYKEFSESVWEVAHKPKIQKCSG